MVGLWRGLLRALLYGSVFFVGSIATDTPGSSDDARKLHRAKIDEAAWAAAAAGQRVCGAGDYSTTCLDPLSRCQTDAYTPPSPTCFIAWHSIHERCSACTHERGESRK